MLLWMSAPPSSLKFLVMCQETTTGTRRQLGASHWRADHPVISAEQAHTSYPSLCVCRCVYVFVSVFGVFVSVFGVCRGDRGEEHDLPGKKLDARHWKPDTYFVFKPQVILGKMRRLVLATNLNFKYVSRESKRLPHLVSSLLDVSSSAPMG